MKNKRNRVKKTIRSRITETDGVYFLKLVICVIMGTLWIKFNQPISIAGYPLGGIPAGMLIGLILVNRFERIQLDRKIWYAILIIVTIICYFVPAGIVF